ncbi:aerobic energy metabolism [Lactococcus lactis subsp. lactis]|uniref:Aldo/keto reductase n=2 Tax=Lactococcus lactis TaxID=1358 RepID=A0A2A5SFP7_LACLH|nr:aerobic energy metabolism [Lactococcus lactis subsp. lactis]PCS12255.1 aldo/keto reductase [Lactococcus lactis subsp. hordniae]
MTYIPNPTRYDHMIYRPAGKSGLLLPALSLGLWHNFGSVDDFENARDMIHTAFHLGITHFDLANNYGPELGSAERNFGLILKEDFQKMRDELIMSTKAGYPMWPGPYGNWAAKKVCWLVLINLWNAWDLTMLIFFIHIVLTQIHLLKKQWGL